MKSFKWWDEEALPQGIQWMSLEHNGIFFPPEYVPHNVKMRYDGREIDLPPELEEVATFFASIPLDGPQLGNEECAKIFRKNFFDEFRVSEGGVAATTGFHLLGLWGSSSEEGQGS